MIQEDQDKQNLAKLHQLNNTQPLQPNQPLQPHLNNSTGKVITRSHEHDHHGHDHSEGCESHNHGSHGHSHNSGGHHDGHKHGPVGKKNYFIIIYTVFTCLSCLYLETQYLNPLIRDKRAQLMTYLCVFDVFMCLWSYFQTMRISSSVRKFQSRDIIPYVGLQIRKCEKCDFIKVPRVSHCSTCGKCIYKLDHHCIWTQTCIGYCNQRPFYLFTFYMTIGVLQFWYSTIRSAAILFESCHFFGTFEPGVYILWAITCVSAGLVGLMIVSLCVGHTLMVSTNFTTLDNLKKKMMCPMPFLECRRPYFQASNVNNWDRGEIQNLKSLFGTNLLTFWMPLGREIDNQFLFEQMSPAITQHISKIPPNCSKQFIKEKLKGKTLKFESKQLVIDQL